MKRAIQRNRWTPLQASLLLILGGCSAGPPPQAAAPVTVAPGVVPGPVTMETVNQRWRGKRCQLRVAAEIRRNTDRTGWSASRWMEAPTLPGDRKLQFRLLVADRAALAGGGYLSRGRSVRPGTIFQSNGWRLSDPGRQRGLVLDLQFEQPPVEARMEFRGGDRLVDLEDVEQVARIELFQLLAD